MTAVFVVAILASILLLYSVSRSELAPQEDQGFVLAQSTFPPNATLQRKLMYDRQAFPTFKATPGQQRVFQIDAPGQAITGVSLLPRNQRELGATAIQQDLQQRLSTLPGARFAVFQNPRCPAPLACRCNSRSKVPNPRNGSMKSHRECCNKRLKAACLPSLTAI